MFWQSDISTHNISNYIKNCWQNTWNNKIHNKLNNINPRIGLGVPLHSLSRREDVVMTHLRLGHTHLTHIHILSNSPSLGVPLHSLSRREDVVMTRLRLGHSHLTHTHILSNSPSPVCPACGTDLTVNHILLTCPVLGTHRNSLSSLDSISKFFQDNSSLTILNYLRNCNLFFKI